MRQAAIARASSVVELALLLDLGDAPSRAAPRARSGSAALLDGADLHLVEAAGRFLAVARDERHRRALRDKAAVRRRHALERARAPRKERSASPRLVTRRRQEEFVTQREHARPAGESTGPEIPEPTYAERARTLVHVGRVGALSTLSRRHADWPFGSVMPYGLDERGNPTFLISTMAMHTQNLLGDPRASLLVTGAGARRGSARSGTGDADGPGGEDHQRRASAKAISPGYPNSSYWVDFKDFAFFPAGGHRCVLRRRLRCHGMGRRRRLRESRTRSARRRGGRASSIT